MPEKAGDQHRPPLTKPSCSPNWLSCITSDSYAAAF
nr:MAG TPA: hypothetical protein [Caudoviricetes sp.]